MRFVDIGANECRQFFLVSHVQQFLDLHFFLVSAKLAANLIDHEEMRLRESLKCVRFTKFGIVPCCADRTDDPGDRRVSNRVPVIFPIHALGEPQ